MVLYGIIVNTPEMDSAYMNNYILGILRQIEKFKQINLNLSAIVINYNYDLIIHLLNQQKNVICMFILFISIIIKLK